MTPLTEDQIQAIEDAYLEDADLNVVPSLNYHTSYGFSPHGYTMHCFMSPEGWYIVYGCRQKTLAEARKHWHPNNYSGDPEVVDWTNMMLDRMETYAD